MSFIKKWMRPEILAQSAYRTHPADKLIKMDAMESPFVLNDAECAEYFAGLPAERLNRYPATDSAELENAVRELMNIPPQFALLFGNGSDELIQILALGCPAGSCVFGMTPGFAMYEIIARSVHLNFVGIGLDENFQPPIEIFKNALDEYSPKLIFIAYPHNPTGNLFDRSIIETMINFAPDTLFVIDEAYYPYAQKSFLNACKRYPNLVILRTLSKIGFAGLRLGMMVGRRETIDEFDKLRLPYNINFFSQESGAFLHAKKNRIRQKISEVIKNRDNLFAELQNISAVEAFPSAANFILFRARKAEALFEFLLENGLLIKNLSAQAGLENCLRVTVSSPADNQKFLQTLKAFYDRH